MASKEVSSQLGFVPLDSHDSSLCIIPPKNLWPKFDHLRSLYDKAYEKWPPHINLVYPFVRVENLPNASALVASQLSSMSEDISSDPIKTNLGAADVFPHKHDNTIFIYDNDKERKSRLEKLRKTALRALGQKTSADYHMHLTIGQSQDINSSAHKSLLQKASLLPATEWTVDRLYILTRERMEIDGHAFSHMKIWGTIDLSTFSVCRVNPPEHFNTIDEVPETVRSNSLANNSYTFSEEGRWLSHQDAPTRLSRDNNYSYLTVASYNVLADFDHPPSKARYPLIIQNILQKSILADILVLQEVTDDFLSFICHNDDFRKHYRFASHGPPDQYDIEPLPSHLNTVVFSRFPFSWYWLPFNRRHKGSVLVKFTAIGKQSGDTFHPTVLATVHLTCGLTEGSVSAKKQELQTMISHLSEKYPRNPWILAGDFNITTSAYTIEAAFKKKAISTQTIGHLKGFENTLTEAGLVDAWACARVEFGDFMDSESDFERQMGTFEGEQGATFDPTVNDLAAQIVGNGLNMRPQRYDRILVKSADFQVTGFNMFGRRSGPLHEHNNLTGSGSENGPAQVMTYASDHWGIRCSLGMKQAEENISSEATSSLSVPVHLKPASSSLANILELKNCLNGLGVFPSDADVTKRKEALELLKEVLFENEHSASRGNPRFVLVPVGSYGLGVWTASSDIDCLCIGPISSSTFFSLATQRIRKAENRGVKLRRRVNAWTGTMIELEVLDIKMDLQYCPSSIIAETWPHAMRLPLTDPVFRLPNQALLKLKAARDMYYIRRTIPDYAAFRTAYHLIREWAKHRGIYLAKFGLLSGIQITVLLTRVCKLLAHEGRSVSLPSILTTFFNHYANFEWSTQLAFDPFFHKQLRFIRTPREPIAILGFHAPNLNTASNASQASARTIANEFKRVDKLLSQEGMTWTAFMNAGQGHAEFLSTYKTFIKIDTQFWGVSLAKGSGFVGWLESRCVMLLVDLQRRIRNIHVQIWPSRFVDEDATEDVTDYQGCYLIGLDRWEGPNGEPMSKDDMKTALGSLHVALRNFETLIREDEKYFDPNTSWMSASLVNRSDLGALRLDNRDWGDYIVGDDESDEEEEEDDDDDDDDEDDGMDDELTRKSKSKSKLKKKATAVTTLPTRPAYEGKFRSSADVLNRIRWDSDMDSGDYVVGYEDRFLGIMERALDAWKSEQTDEEFIPQHRILFFKRKSDGVVVWDRKERRDVVFGSGVK